MGARLIGVSDRHRSRKRTSEQCAREGERLLAQRVHVPRQRSCCQCAAVHGVNPCRLEGFDAIDHVPYRILVRERCRPRDTWRTSPLQDPPRPRVADHRAE
jgi:hypothetical protein